VTRPRTVGYVSVEYITRSCLYSIQPIGARRKHLNKTLVELEDMHFLPVLIVYTAYCFSAYNPRFRGIPFMPKEGLRELCGENISESRLVSPTGTKKEPYHARHALVLSFLKRLIFDYAYSRRSIRHKA